jgi:hypothetical protein
MLLDTNTSPNTDPPKFFATGDKYNVVGRSLQLFALQPDEGSKQP